MMRINGIQHIGLAVKDMDHALPFYRKFIGLDIPFFDSVAAAPLMDIYTRNNTITKRASMILNLQGGCAMEIIQPTSFDPTDASSELMMGDLGIVMTQVKSPNIEASFAFCKANGAAPLSEISALPNGLKTFIIADTEGNYFQFVENKEFYTSGPHHCGGVLGCSIGVSDMKRSFELYKDILGYDEVVYDETGTFDDWKGTQGGTGEFRRVLLTQSNQPGGGFAKVAGKTFIELVQAINYTPKRTFENRIWADPGYVHLGFDVKDMTDLGRELKKKGFGFTCDSNDALDMGNTKVHCTYIDDPDQTWIEMIEVYKVPIIEKWGVFLNVAKRDPLKPLPDFMLKALRFSRIKD